MLRSSTVAAAFGALLLGLAQASPIINSRQTIYGWQVFPSRFPFPSFFNGGGVPNYYLSVGHDEAVNGYLLDCGTTSTVFNGQVFAKCTVNGVTPTVTQRDASNILCSF